MLLPDNLLNPIPGANPSGENLRYVGISKRDPTHYYDKLDDLRREEDAVSDWKEEGKKADYDQVIKLATDALANRTKDIWIASRLTEALLKKYGFGGFREGLDLLRGLLENFWDTLYPALDEDGDAELRATPLDWIATRFGAELRCVPLTRPKPPLTKAGFTWFEWEPSTRIPTEEAAKGSDGDRDKRKEAIAEKKVTPEAFGEAFALTPKTDYKTWAVSLDGIDEAIDGLDGVCKEKFGAIAPSFEALRRVLDDDLKLAVRRLLKAKLEVDPDPVEQPAETTAAEEVAEAEPAAQASEEAAAEPRAAARRAAITTEPVDRDDAVRRLEAIARYLRQQEPYSPVPYLILRGLRWGELRASGPEIDQLLCEAPPTEIRQQVKRAALEGNWAGVLEAAETAMGMPCGRAWLDLHRYVIKACGEQGSYYDPIAASVRSALKALLTDYPQLASMTLMDDTATANAETLAWLQAEIVPPPPEAAPAEPAAPTPAPEVQVPAIAEEHEPAEQGPPDPYELATDAARRGRTPEAISILSAATAHERSGRARFRRKVQLAGICMATGNEAVAFPILVELSNEVERLKLEDWEAPEIVAQPLVLLYQCLSKLGRDKEEKQRVYDRICRLDPAKALECR